jgi:hypothetical protein
MIEVAQPPNYDRSKNGGVICSKMEISKNAEPFISTIFAIVLSTNLLLVEIVEILFCSRRRWDIGIT